MELQVTSHSKMSVEKMGWKTGHTKGTYLYLVSFILNYSVYENALFQDQLGIVGFNGGFSTDGDSGSVVINAQGEAVGLVFADADKINLTFANPISKVFNFFGVTPV